MNEESVNTRRLQFRTADLLSGTGVVALTVAAANEDPIILLVLLAGILGAVTGHLVSGAFRFGFVGGLLLGVLGYLLAVFAVSLGVKTADRTLFFACVCAGGVMGGLVPTMLNKWRHASLRSRLGLVLAGSCLLVLLTMRWKSINEQDRLVAELQAAGAIVSYSDLNPLPTLFDESRMQSGSPWLRKLLGLRVVTRLTLRPTFAPVNSWMTSPITPLISDLSLHAEQMNDEAFAFLNSGKLARLDSLRFSGREFDDTSLSRLHPLPNLVLLDLESTSVTDKSVEHITSFPGLKILSVRQTDLTSDGVKRLESKIGRVVSK